MSTAKTVLFIALLALCGCPPGAATPTSEAAPSSVSSATPHLFFPGSGATLQWTQYTGTTTFTVPVNVKGYSVQECGGGGSGGVGSNGASGGGANHPGVAEVEAPNSRRAISQCSPETRSPSQSEPAARRPPALEQTETLVGLRP